MAALTCVLPGAGASEACVPEDDPAVIKSHRPHPPLTSIMLSGGSSATRLLLPKTTEHENG